MAAVYPRQYMITENGDDWWKYAAYRKHKILGVSFWSKIRQSNDIATLRGAINIDMQLPIFIDEPRKEPAT